MLSDAEPANPPSRTRSILNLTSSTLLGIYSSTGYAPDRDEPTTPWGTGAETPIDGRPVDFSRFEGQDVDDALLMRSKARRGSMLDQSTKQPKSKPSRAAVKAKKQKGFRATVVPLVGKTSVLGAVGVAYGVLISHLHDRQQLAPVQVDGISHGTWGYLVFWSVMAVLLGQMMPYVDRIWDGDEGTDDAGAEYRSSGGQKSAQDHDGRGRNRGWAPVWNDVVRTIGATVGIAFAIVSRQPLSYPLPSLLN